MAYFKGSNDRGGDRAPRGGSGGSRGGFRPSGGRPPFRPSNRGDRPELFDVICSDCGKKTLVPFKPTGDRDVFCRDCFAKRGGGEERGREAGARNGHEKFAKRERPDHRDFAPRPSMTPMSQVSPMPQVQNNSGDVNTEVKRQLEQVNVKLERLILAVQALAVTVQVKSSDSHAVTPAKPAKKLAKKAAKK